MLTYPPPDSGLPTSSSRLWSDRTQSALRPGPAQNRDRQVPRAPLPGASVTRPGVASSTTSKGVTPSSSLIRAHASDQIPPTGFGLPIPADLRRLSQAPAGRWPFPTLFPVILARSPGPVPRGVHLVHVLDVFPGGNGLRADLTRSAHRRIPAMQLRQGVRFRGCSHSLMFRLPCSLGPPVAPTAEPLQALGSRAGYTTQDLTGCPHQVVASLRVRSSI